MSKHMVAVKGITTSRMLRRLLFDRDGDGEGEGEEEVEVEVEVENFSRGLCFLLSVTTSLSHTSLAHLTISLSVITRDKKHRSRWWRDKNMYGTLSRAGWKYTWLSHRYSAATTQAAGFSLTLGFWCGFSHTSSL